MENPMEGDNVCIEYRNISSSLTSDIPLFVFVCRHEGPAYLPECNGN